MSESEEENTEKNLSGRPLNCTPDELFDAFQKYKEEMKSNPIIVLEQKRGATNLNIPKGAEASIVQTLVDSQNPIVEMPHRRPLTLDGFETWCYDNNIGCVHQYFQNTGARYPQFVAICSRIKTAIRSDQIEGGLVGLYNPSITQRLNGLVDKKEVDNKHEIKIPPVPDIGSRK